MKWRYLVWVAVALLAAGFAAVMIPGSPLALERTLGDPVADGRPLRQWTADLASPDRGVRVAALDAVASIAPQAAATGRATAPVTKLLAEDPDPEVREKAAFVLSRFAAAAAGSVPALVKGLGDERTGTRLYSALALLALKADARPAVPALLAALDDPRNDIATGTPQTIQGVAAAALGAASAGTPDAVPALVAVLGSDRPLPLKTTAARALGQIGPPARPAVPALTALLKHTDLEVREEATIALRALGETVPDVVRPDASESYNRQMRGGGGGEGAPPAKK